MRYTHLLFDLDGTLIDSKRGIFNAVYHTLNMMGIPETFRPADLSPFIGPPLRDSFKLLFGFSDNDAEKATAIYREYYGKTGLYEYDIFDGITNSIKYLGSKGYNLSVVTSKAEVYAKLIVESLPFCDSITVISGCELDGTRSDKHELIKYTLNKLNIVPSGNIIMIGDRYHDIRGAKTAGVSSAAVLYGYGSKAELSSESPTLLIDSPEQLISLDKL